MTVTHRPSAQAAVAAAPIMREVAQRGAIVAVWIAMIAFFSIAAAETFPRVSTFHVVFGSQSHLVFLSMALLCTVCVGEFVDLSVASVFGLSATLVPTLVVLHGWDVAPACAAAVAAAVLVGVVNGVLVVVVRVNTVVTTLGMGTLLLGVSLWMTNLSPVSGLGAGFARVASTSVAGLPLAFYYGVVVTLVFAYVLAFTPLGRHIQFVAANREVSRLAGVRVGAIRFGAFVMAGLLCGLGGVVTTASLGGFDANVSQTYLLPTFAAVFLGTAVIQPGRFNPIGTFIGIYFLATGILGLQLLGYTGWVSHVFYGAVLVVAVALSTVLRKRKVEA